MHNKRITSVVEVSCTVWRLQEESQHLQGWLGFQMKTGGVWLKAVWLAMNEIVNTSGGNELSASGASPNKDQPSLSHIDDECNVTESFHVLLLWTPSYYRVTWSLKCTQKVLSLSFAQCLILKQKKTCNQSLFFYCRKQTFSWYCSAFETIINPIILLLQVGYRNQNTDENLVLVCDIWNESNIDLAAVFKQSTNVMWISPAVKLWGKTRRITKGQNFQPLQPL